MYKSNSKKEGDDGDASPFGTADSNDGAGSTSDDLVDSFIPLQMFDDFGEGEHMLARKRASDS